MQEPGDQDYQKDYIEVLYLLPTCDARTTFEHGEGHAAARAPTRAAARYPGQQRAQGLNNHCYELRQYYCETDPSLHVQPKEQGHEHQPSTR